MAKELVERILQQYGLTAAHVHEVEKGYRNQSYAAELRDGRILNLILYKREEGILERVRRANRVSDFLAGEGYPARKTADRRVTTMKSGDYIKYAALYEYLPGKTIPWEAYTMEHIKRLGGAMSDMHALLKKLPQEDLPFVIDECRDLLRRMEKYFAEDGVHDALAGKLGLSVPDTSAFRSALTAAIGLPAQTLHMDFVRGNILFSGAEKGKITGVLDFEKTAWGPPVFDISRTLAFLLVDCKYKESDKVRKYFLHSGYNKRGQSQFPPNPLLETLLNFFLLHDFYKFLRHNPYESLVQNEHFVRTRDILLKRNIVMRTEMLE